MKIFLDDIRFPIDVFNYTGDELYFQSDWVIVRNYENFISAINNAIFSKIEIISFDHDLADEHYGREETPWSVERSIDYFSYREKTGYDCAKWLCDYCLDNELKFPEYLVHSFKRR